MKTWVLGFMMLFWMTVSFGQGTTHDQSSASSYYTSDQWKSETESSNPTRQSTSVEGRGKKDEKLMHSMYMGMMMVKAFFSIIFMFVNGIFQLKSFGFSLLNAIINIGRFLLQYNAQHKEQKIVKLPTDWASTGYGGYGGYGYGAAYGNQNYQAGTYPSAYSHQEQYQPETAPADKVYRVQSNQDASYLANSMAYSGYTSNQAGTRT